MIAAAGFGPSSAAPETQARAALALVAIEVSLASYVHGGLRLRGHRLRELFGQARRGDLLFGLIAAAALLALSILVQRLFPGAAAESTLRLLPRAAAERALWLLVAAVVACSEELVFRGYLQRQLEAWGAGFVGSALAQAAIFAAAHANQGAPAAVGIGVSGLLLAFLARWRRGLSAAIFAHFLVDACATFWT